MESTVLGGFGLGFFFVFIYLFVWGFLWGLGLFFGFVVVCFELGVFSF